MAKFKVGDVLKPSAKAVGYIHAHLIEGETYIVESKSGHLLDIKGKFKSDFANGRDWNEDWFELAETSDLSAESLRNSILDIRSKREALRKEILQLDVQEKEAVEKLKELGFVLYEGNVSKGAVVTESKAVLYAEDIEADMTDPRNWRIGDELQVISEDVANILPHGSIQQILAISGDRIRFTDAHSSCVESVEYITKYFKFHSRPVK